MLQTDQQPNLVLRFEKQSQVPSRRSNSPDVLNHWTSPSAHHQHRSEPWPLTVRCGHQQRQHYPGACYKCSLSGPHPQAYGTRVTPPWPPGAWRACYGLKRAALSHVPSTLAAPERSGSCLLQRSWWNWSGGRSGRPSFQSSPGDCHVSTARIKQSM